MKQGELEEIHTRPGVHANLISGRKRVDLAASPGLPGVQKKKGKPPIEDHPGTRFIPKLGGKNLQHTGLLERDIGRWVQGGEKLRVRNSSGTLMEKF